MSEPKVEIRDRKDRKKSLYVADKYKMTAKDILFYTLFDTGKKIALIYTEGDGMKLAYFCLNQSMSGYHDFDHQPKPDLDSAFAVQENAENKKIIISYRSRNQFYLLCFECFNEADIYGPYKSDPAKSGKKFSDIISKQSIP